MSLDNFSVLINESSHGFFQSSRGLMQGDPLSPYLFMVVMEALSQLVERVVVGGFLSACKVGGRCGEGVSVFHLLFVDDTLIFDKYSQDQITFHFWLLMWFEALSGLKINLEKSESILIGRVEDVETLAAELGCKVGSLPTTYLGLPLGVWYKSVGAWDGVEERLERG